MPIILSPIKVFFDGTFIEAITNVELEIHQPMGVKPDPYMAALYAQAFADTLEERLAPIPGSPRGYVEYEPTGPREWSGSFNAPVDFQWVGKPIHLYIDGYLSGEIVIDSSTSFVGIGAPQHLTNNALR